ncbi:right-handed parallel beta-helix repeat-containing protein [Nocardioides terrisoli]|uniref:right-handed parallel beta-helix repeat-containing protein n=1 Tax=Nocardioides terrisoli TaxID=3388267 RepID=UPI00287BA960|nr:right-handed parallel beta-helix repeat-containing protein [Nocardioides marmorisolisilvae]
MRTGTLQAWRHAGVWLCVSGGAATGLLALGVWPAGATTLSCGSVVTESVTLTNDLTGCTGDGLDIGADGITIDLNGHTISGTGSGLAGVSSGGHSGVTIANGTVRGFIAGVTLQGGSDGTVRSVTATGNQFGIIATGTSDAAITGSTAVKNGLPGDNGNGISVVDATNTLVSDDVANGNGFGGINVIGGDGTTVERSVANSNHVNGVLVQGAADTTVTGVTANDNIDNGFFVRSDASNTSIAQSRANATREYGGTNGNGMLIQSPSTVLSDTVTNGNQAHGIDAVTGVTATHAIAHGNKAPADCMNVACS